MIASPGQSRARGLTRAILDTFPVVKFGTSSDLENGRPTSGKDVESNRPSNDVGTECTNVEMQGWEVVDRPDVEKDDDGGEHPLSIVAQSEGTPDHGESGGSNGGTTRRSSAGTRSESTEATRADDNHGEGSSRPRRPRASVDTTDVTPDAIGRETCPICIVDFEEGDDLRLLPCEGKHRFHQQCVDPWLLELSSSCPICRQGATFCGVQQPSQNLTGCLPDFHALENMLWGAPNESGGWHAGGDRESRRMSAAASGSPGNRFSRYLRSARRRNRENANTLRSTQPRDVTSLVRVPL